MVVVVEEVVVVEVVVVVEAVVVVAVVVVVVVAVVVLVVVVVVVVVAVVLGRVEVLHSASQRRQLHSNWEGKSTRGQVSGSRTSDLLCAPDFRG